jgi:hypothetical protein
LILIGNQRGNAKELAIHLLKEENERVEVHQVRGFVSEHLNEVFQESYAISRATQCKQHLYSLSLNPPKNEKPTIQDFECAINQVEKQLGLIGQPRVIVFHEKRGFDGELRKHAHAVWCRIDTEKMKAIHLPFTYKKLREVSRSLFVEHNWRMPDGLIDSKNRNPHNYSLAEWQQAKRAGKNAKELKALFQDCWSCSDSKTALKNALWEQGFVLAKGKRGHVAVDYQGEVYPLSRWTGLKAKQVRERIGEANGLPSVEQAHALASKIISDRLKVLKKQEKQVAAAKQKLFREQRNKLQTKHAYDRTQLCENQNARQLDEEAERARRVRKGLFGLWDRVTGKRKQIVLENAKEADTRQISDQIEKEDLNSKHKQTLQQQQKETEAAQTPHRKSITELNDDIAWLQKPPELSNSHGQTNENEADSRKHIRNRSRDGPQFGR